MNTNQQPLVTIILTVFNHQNYIEDCLNSIFLQSYGNIQLIVIDNASLDGTVTEIEKYQKKKPGFLIIKNLHNKGLCKAFNQGLASAHGKYIIDLSGDDVLVAERIERQVATFEMLAEDHVVVFSNARYIDQDGGLLDFHYPVSADGKALAVIPAGDIYKRILEKYFICTPTMMMRTSIVKQMGGYDESLVFEDFDFWVRSAVKYKYFYLDEVLTLKRNCPDSLRTMIYKKGSGMLASYYKVCNKAYDLNRDQEEFDLLAARIRTFIRKCFYAQEFELALKFRTLLNYIENPGWKTEMIILLCHLHVPVNRIYRFYIHHFQIKINRAEGFGF